MRVGNRRSISEKLFFATLLFRRRNKDGERGPWSVLNHKLANLMFLLPRTSFFGNVWYLRVFMLDLSEIFLVKLITHLSAPFSSAAGEGVYLRIFA